MTCYDCDLAARSDTTAIGICSQCGLFVCRQHGRVAQAAVHQVRGTGRATGVRAARRVVCQTCHGAGQPG